MTQDATSIYNWTFQADAAISDTHHIHLIYWNTGMSLIAYSIQNKVVQARHYEWSATLAPEQLAEILLDEPLFGGAEAVTKLWVASDKNMLLPKQLFDAEQNEVWFKKLHFVSNDEKIEVSHVSQPAGYSFDAINTSLLDVILQHSNEVPTTSLFASLLDTFPINDGNFGLTFIGNKAIIQAYKDKQLQFLQLTESSFAHILHWLQEFTKNQSLQQQDVNIVARGYGANASTTLEELKAYFTVTVADWNEDFFNTLALCE